MQVPTPSASSSPSSSFSPSRSVDIEHGTPPSATTKPGIISRRSILLFCLVVIILLVVLITTLAVTLRPAADSPAPATTPAPAHPDIARGDSSACRSQAAKNRKYESVAARLGAELLNVCVDATGGMATGVFRLVEAVGDEGERWLGAWSSASIQRRLLACIATAVQRGNAMAMLAGYTRATSGRARRDVPEEQDSRRDEVRAGPGSGG